MFVIFKTSPPLLLAFVILAISLPSNLMANDETQVAYVEIDPVIVTNYQRAKGKKPGFIQIQAQIQVYGKTAAEVVEKNLPLIRDTIIEFLSFTDEDRIKDVSQRNQLRQEIMLQVNKVLNETLGHDYVEDFVFTHFTWG